jgi:D-alanyl-D-alanine carboxypeptidase
MDRDVDLQHAISNIVWAKLSKELFTNNETMSKLLNKMFRCFNNQNILDEKQTMIHHLIANAQKTNDMLKVQDAFDNGVVSVKNAVYVETFSNTAYIDKMTFTKNVSGTYTVELSCDGVIKSQSKRASTANVSRMICSLLQLAHTIDF